MIPAPPPPAGVDPVLHPEITAFWDGAAAGQLLLPRCLDCGHLRFPIVGVCPSCLSAATIWEPVGNGGRVRVAIVVERPPRGSAWVHLAPFATGLVDLDAGVRMPGRLLCACGDALRPGTPVSWVPVPAAGRPSTYAFRHRCTGTDDG